MMISWNQSIVNLFKDCQVLQCQGDLTGALCAKFIPSWLQCYDTPDSYLPDFDAMKEATSRMHAKDGPKDGPRSECTREISVQVRALLTRSPGRTLSLRQYCSWPVHWRCLLLGHVRLLPAFLQGGNMCSPSMRTEREGWWDISKIQISSQNLLLPEWNGTKAGILGLTNSRDITTAEFSALEDHKLLPCLKLGSN